MSRLTQDSNIIISSASPIPTPMQRFTVCIWVKPESLSNLQGEPDLFGFCGASFSNLGFFVIVGGSDTSLVEGCISGSSQHISSVSGVLSVGTWVHLAFSFDFAIGGFLKIYKNGVLQSTTNGSPATPGETPHESNSGYVWRLGVLTPDDVPTFVFNGLFSDFRVYSSVLSDSDISSIFANGNPQPSSLAMRWKLCAGETGAIDSSGNGFNGTLVGTVSPSTDDPLSSICQLDTSKTYSIDSDIQTNSSKIYLIDAKVRIDSSDIFSIDAIAQANSLKTHNIDAIVPRSGINIVENSVFEKVVNKTLVVIVKG